jgi:hypothetical protein
VNPDNVTDNNNVKVMSFTSFLAICIKKFF